jgi:hypothetical protein
MNDFLPTLFEGYSDPALRIEIRCLAPKWKSEGYHAESQFYPLIPNAMAGAVRYAERMRESWDVYVGVLPRVGNRKSNDSVFGAACLYADVDGGEEGYQGSIDLLKRCGLPSPNIAVISGGGLHAYWLLDAPFIFETQEQRELFSVTLRRLQKAIGGASPNAHADEACKDAARILRIPNTFNLKRQGEPRPVRMVRNNTTKRLSYTAWLALLPLVPIAQKTYSRKFEKAPESLPRWVVEWIAAPLMEGNRNRDLTRVSYLLGKDYHFTEAEVSTILYAKAANCHPSPPESELKSIARNATRGNP